MYFCIWSLHLSFLFLFESPKIYTGSLLFKGKSQRIILLQNPWNIWPPAHIAPFPKKGTQPSLFQNRHPIVGCLGAAAWSFCLMAGVCLPGKQCSTGLHPGTMRWPGVHGQSWTVGGNLSHGRGTTAFRYASVVEQAHEIAAAGR